MWLFTPIGFYSAVKKPGQAPGQLVIRSRCKSDLVRLLHATGAKASIIDNAGTDYPFRVCLDQSVWALFVYKQASGINYSNFKAQIDVASFESIAQKNRRHDAYMDVWSALIALEDTMPRRRKRTWGKSDWENNNLDRPLFSPGELDSIGNYDRWVEEGSGYEAWLRESAMPNNLADQKPASRRKASKAKSKQFALKNQ